MTPRTVILATLALLSTPAPAAAQQYLLGGHAAVASGIESGDPGTGTQMFRRARTRLIAGVDARIDENPNDGFGLIIFTEIEPHVSVGGELRYMRWFSPRFVAFAGMTAAFAPKTLFGGDFGVQLHIPLGTSSSVFFEPSFSAVPLGTDIPSDRVLLWGLLSAGIHANL